MDIPESEVIIQKDDEQVYLSGVILTHQLQNLDARSSRLKIVGTIPEIIIQQCLDYINTYLT